MNNFYIHKTSVDTVDVKEVLKQGRRFLVVPVVAAVESVMNGKLVLAEELAKSALTLNGRPITIDHPSDRTGSILANRPDVFTVGNVYEAYLDNRELKAKAWLDKEFLEKAGKKGQEILEAIKNKKPLEVSLGWFQETIDQTGIQFGKPYNQISTNIQHDHLAILLNKEGACSLNDGCGLVRNEEAETPAFNFIKESLIKLGLLKEDLDKDLEVKNMSLVNNEEVTEKNDNRAILAAIQSLSDEFKKLETSIQNNSDKIETLDKIQTNSLKAPVINRLVNNEQCPLDKEALTALSLEDLEKLEVSYKPKSYKGNGFSTFNASLDPDEVEFKFKEVQ